MSSLPAEKVAAAIAWPEHHPWRRTTVTEEAPPVSAPLIPRTMRWQPSVGAGPTRPDLRDVRRKCNG